MSDGTIQDTVDRFILWGARRDRGLARVEWDSASARESVLERLRSYFGADLMEIPFPVDGTPFENVDQLFSRFGGTNARAVSITGIESVFANDDRRLQTLAALSFRREALASFALIQIWWIPSVIAEQFILGVPDLESWFQLRLHLTDASIEDAPLSIGASQNKNTPEEATNLAERFWERFPVAQSQNVPLKRIWVELARPALAALFSVGLLREARAIQDRFAGLAGSFEEELKEVIGKIGFPSNNIGAERVALDSNDLKDLTASADFATMLYVQGDLPSARRLQELVLLIRDRLVDGDRRETARSAGNLAATLFALKEFSEARRLQEMSVERYRQSLGEEHPDTLASINNLASILFKLGMAGEARELQEKLVATMKRVLSENDINRMRAIANLAGMLFALGERERARQLGLELVASFSGTAGTGHREAVTALLEKLSVLPLSFDAPQFSPILS